MASAPAVAGDRVPCTGKVRQGPPPPGHRGDVTRCCRSRSGSHTAGSVPAEASRVILGRWAASQPSGRGFLHCRAPPSSGRIQSSWAFPFMPLWKSSPGGRPGPCQTRSQEPSGHPETCLGRPGAGRSSRKPCRRASPRRRMSWWEGGTRQGSRAPAPQAAGTFELEGTRRPSGPGSSLFSEYIEAQGEQELADPDT